MYFCVLLLFVFLYVLIYSLYIFCAVISKINESNNEPIQLWTGGEITIVIRIVEMII